MPFYVWIKNKCLSTASEREYTPRKQQEESVSSSHTISDIEDLSFGQNSASGKPSRILKDAFHIMQMIKVSLRHGMPKEFSHAQRDVIFIVDLNDKANVEEYLLSINTTWKDQMVKDASWIFDRVRRYIPPPDELYRAVSSVSDEYGKAV